MRECTCMAVTQINRKQVESASEWAPVAILNFTSVNVLQASSRPTFCEENPFLLLSLLQSLCVAFPLCACSCSHARLILLVQKLRIESFLSTPGTGPVSSAHDSNQFLKCMPDKQNDMFSSNLLGKPCQFEKVY